MTSIAELLRLSTMTLATTGAAPGGGSPITHTAPVYFVALPSGGEASADSFLRSLRLYFFSDPKSLHAQHLRMNPTTAAALYPESSSWKEIRGLQMRGRAEILPSGPEWDHAWGLYQQKFPFVNGLKLIVARNSFYVFQPLWLRLVDNRKGFGFKQEWTLPDDDQN